MCETIYTIPRQGLVIILRLGKPSLHNTKLLYLLIMITYYAKRQASANLPYISHFDRDYSYNGNFARNLNSLVLLIVLSISLLTSKPKSSS